MIEEKKNEEEISELLSLLEQSADAPKKQGMTPKKKRKKTAEKKSAKSEEEIQYVAEHDKVAEEEIEHSEISSEVICIEDLLEMPSVEESPGQEDIFLEIMTEKQSPQKPPQVFTLTDFAQRPHDKMMSKLFMEAKREEGFNSIILGVTFSVWILSLLIFFLIPVSSMEIKLETYYEWKIRMTDDDVFGEMLRDQLNTNGSRRVIDGQNISLAGVGLASSAPNNQNNSGGVSQPRVQRALRILSTTSVMSSQGALSSGDATLQDFLRDPSSISLTSGASLPVFSGGNAVMATVGADTAQLNFQSTGGELVHSTRIEMSHLPTLTGDPVAISQRSSESIANVITRHFSEIRHLFNSAREVNPVLSGKVVISITIASNGEVLGVSVLSSTLNDPSFERKLIDLVCNWKFQSLEDTTLSPLTVDVPFNFIDF
ncbi:TonB family protein [candidate division WOR-3 bacterium]|nr:TonB family protein [candidate division WOR-3 bacterium]